MDMVEPPVPGTAAAAPLLPSPSLPLPPPPHVAGEAGHKREEAGKDEEDEEDEDEEDEEDEEEEGNTLPLHGDPKTMNFEVMLYKNICSSDYFKDLYELRTYHEVLEEIYNQVENLDCWMPTVAVQYKKPSTAFTLLYKLFTLKLTRRQVNDMLRNKDSAYIRALAFLYLRYTQPPKDLWGWFVPQFGVDWPIHVGHDSQTELPMGAFLADLLLEKKHCSTWLPRIPIPLLRRLRQQFKGHLMEQPNSVVRRSRSASVQEVAAEADAERVASRCVCVHREPRPDTAETCGRASSDGVVAARDGHAPTEKKRRRGRDRTWDMDRPASRGGAAAPAPRDEWPRDRDRGREPDVWRPDGGGPPGQRMRKRRDPPRREPDRDRDRERWVEPRDREGDSRRSWRDDDERRDPGRRRQRSRERFSRRHHHHHRHRHHCRSRSRSRSQSGSREHHRPARPDVREPPPQAKAAQPMGVSMAAAELAEDAEDSGPRPSLVLAPPVETESAPSHLDALREVYGDGSIPARSVGMPGNVTGAERIVLKQPSAARKFQRLLRASRPSE